MARLSPFVSRHLGVHGTYSFVLPDLAPGAIRELRNPDVPEEDDDYGRRGQRARGHRRAVPVVVADSKYIVLDIGCRLALPFVHGFTANQADHAGPDGPRRPGAR